MNRIPFCFAIIAGFAAAVLGTAAASAGEWQELSQDNQSWDQCSHEFVGSIERGDLVNYLNEAYQREEYVRRLCLNSPGGSLSEVLDVVEAFSFSTRVRSGEECSSACAILFMFGISPGANSLFPDRILEPGAKLGFHSPFITSGQASKVGSSDAFRVAIQISKLLADRSYTTITVDGPAVPPELLALVLGTPADQMRYIDRIGELQLLNIETDWSRDKDVRVENSRESVITVLKRICVTSYALTFRRALTKQGYAFDDLVEWVSKTLRDDEIDVHTLHHVPVDGDFPGRYESMMTGPFHHPHWNSAGAAMYCNPTLAYQADGERIRVEDSYVDFDLIQGRDLSTIAGSTQTYKEVTAGLVPLDTVYAE